MKNNIPTIWKRVFAFGLFSAGLLLFSGCNVLGFLANPTAFEEKVQPEYDLQGAQERKILVWIECPKSLNIDRMTQEKLTEGFYLYMTQKMDITPENIMQKPAGMNDQFSVDPVRQGRRLGAGYLLLVQVDEFDLTNLQVRDLFSGDMVTRSVLLDTATGLTVWPGQPEGKMIHTSVDMEEGRDTVEGKLISGTVHCILRYLYPCPQVQFKNSTERMSTQEAFELGTN